MASNYAYCNSNGQNSRGVAMVLALVSAVVLSPLYVTRKNHEENSRFYETTKWNSGFLLPVVVGGLIIAIRTTSSSASSSLIPSPNPSWVLRIGSSSWGLAGVLLMLMLVLSWQDSVQDFFWR